MYSYFFGKLEIYSRALSTNFAYETSHLSTVYLHYMFNKPWILESKKCPSLVQILKYWTEGVNMCTRKDERYRLPIKDEISETTVQITYCMFPYIHDFLQLQTCCFICQIIKAKKLNLENFLLNSWQMLSLDYPVFANMRFKFFFKIWRMITSTVYQRMVVNYDFSYFSL